MQNDLEVSVLDVYARKDEIGIKKKVVSMLFVGILVVSVLIGILTVISEEVRAETWSIETVDSAGIGHDITIALALDSKGYPHISYYDETNRTLKYAKWIGSKWSITTVDSAGRVGMYTSIALDSKGYPHISYYGMTIGALKYAKWTGSKWSIETVDSDGSVGQYTSIALDSKGYPHMSYNDLDALKYAKWTGSKWSIETVDNIRCIYISIALDSKGYPHISYLDYTNNNLKYAKWTGSKWSIEIVDSDSPFTSIALDSKGYPHISYYDETNRTLKYAKGTGSKWSIETVDSAGNVGMYASLALDSNGNPHISYFDYTNKDLKYAKAGSKWSIETVDSAGDVGYDTSIALDSKGYPHISYFDNTNDVLKYAAELMFLKVPTQPRNLQATASDGRVNLKWTAPSDDGGSPITNYNIYRGTTPGGETLRGRVSNVLSYTDDYVINNQTYYYQVSAENSAGEGEMSDEVREIDEGNNVERTPGIFIPSLEVSPTPTEAPPTPLETEFDYPDLVILNAEFGEFSDDMGVLVLSVRVANRGNAGANETQVYAWDPESGMLSEYSSVPALLPGEDEWVGIELAILEEQRGITHTFRVEVDPEEMVTELNEGNNIEWTRGIVIPPLKVSPTPTGPTPSPTTTPVREGPDPVPLILIVVAIATLGGITLIIRHHIITPHHKKWQVEAKEEEPPEHCQYCTHHCRKIELELDPAMRKIAYLSLGAYDPVHGEQIKDGQVTGEIVDGLNKVVSARHRRVNAEKLQELVTPQAHALLQQIMGLLREELAPRDVSLTGHLEGGKVTCQFILYHCKRSGNVNIWEEEAKWEATIKDERDEPVGTLHSIAPSEPGISERLTPALTRLLMQFIEQV